MPENITGIIRLLFIYPPEMKQLTYGFVYMFLGTLKADFWVLPVFFIHSFIHSTNIYGASHMYPISTSELWILYWKVQIEHTIISECCILKTTQ